MLHNASMPAPGRCLCAFGSMLSEVQSRFTPCKRAFFVAWLGDSEITPTRPWRVGVKLRYPLNVGGYFPFSYLENGSIKIARSLGVRAAGGKPKWSL